MPHETLEMIALYLPAELIASLRKASGSFNLAAHDPSFWRNQMRQRMPWARELWDLLEKTDPSTVVFRMLFSWRDWEMPVPYGIRLQLLPLANRMRIWDVCEQIRETYIKYTRLLPHTYTEVKYHVILQDLRKQRARELRSSDARVPLPEGAAWE
ncbi:hypothetical protein BDV19DRAFT_385668 [Aspergillus venezuelensis]